MSCLSPKVATFKRCTCLGKLVKFVGQTAVDVVYGIQKRGPESAWGVFKECGGVMPDGICGIVLHMRATRVPSRESNVRLKLPEQTNCGAGMLCTRMLLLRVLFIKAGVCFCAVTSS